jgi:pimeloyl-ACP methyl ester carboxylesterase
MHTTRSRFVEHGGVRLHYVDSFDDETVDRELAPVVFVPGMGDEADEYHGLLDDLLPRRVLSVDVRGRGRSAAPGQGWSPAHHVADLDAVIADAGVTDGADGRVHMASYSRGTGYSLGWAITHPERVRSVTIGDYFAGHVRVPEQYRPGFHTRKWRGRPMNERMTPEAIDGVFAESEDVEMFDELGALGVPVLLVRGTAPGAIVTDELAARYRATVPGIEIVDFEGSGHDLWRPDPHRFSRTLQEFFDRIDAPTTGGPAT